MKKRLFTLLLVIIATLALAACNKAKEEETTAATTAAKKEVTITFVNGDTVLGELKVTEGELVKGYEKFEKVAKFNFDGWYKTPTLLASSAVDFTKDTFNEDTKIFGSFKAAELEEDTRNWYVVGEGSGIELKTSAWAGSSVDEAGRELCQLKPTGNAKNEFAITLDLYVGDNFQIIHDWKWDGQKGFGRLTSVDATQFESAGSLSGESSKANIKVIMEGNYTITLTTDPSNALYDTITIVRNGDAAPAVVVVEEPYVVNEKTQVVMKGSWVSDWSENIELTRTEDSNIFVGTKELEAGTELYFMVWDDGADTGIGMNATAVVDEASLALLTENYNIKVTEAGTYTFTVDVTTLTITVTK